ncbi:MAG: DISARM system SNF2-like helicase DrmD, partial [Phycisphaerales bacterium]
MISQWRDELESRFGLTFEVLDREYMRRIREERGYSVNPWTTFPRFLISHKLLIDETYAAPMRDWLDNLRPGSLLILDEAHHAAPSSGAKYAIDSRITKSVRDLAPRFEHRLFLSATPHNGHSNSFSALLEILDPQRFTRAVSVRATDLDAVMVRRLKDDIREISDQVGRAGGGFPKRIVKQVDIDGLSPDAPELKLSKLLNEYREVRLRRVAGESKRKQAEAMLLISGLQQRLLSSVSAFARTLAAHRRTMEKIWDTPAGKSAAAQLTDSQMELVSSTPDADDDRAELDENDLAQLEDAAISAATESTRGTASDSDVREEQRLVREMEITADAHRDKPDARIKTLIEWIRTHMRKGSGWNDLRILIFTEWEDTRRYIVNMLQREIVGSDRADERISMFMGSTPPDKRDAIKRAFNAPPSEHPVRILVATDAAREGLNLQAHCWNLFHFDVPWNPSRLEQRNGRIDRKLQPHPEVVCHYFVYSQRREDRVLKVLVEKTRRIRQELGSLSQVLENRLAGMLSTGISHEVVEKLAADIESADLDKSQRDVTQDELEGNRKRRDQLKEQIRSLETRLKDSRQHIGLDHAALRDALSCSLEMLGAAPLEAAADGGSFRFPNLGVRHGSDSSWADTLDTLRALPKDGIKSFAWRRESPVRPVVFEPPAGIDEHVVQLHLQHRVVQRLLGRFLSQGFV